MAKTAIVRPFVTVPFSFAGRLAQCGAVACVGLAVLTAASPAAAQNLPPVTTERLSTAQQSQVREYVESRLSTLENADPSGSEVLRARRELIDPMRNRNTSVAMRQAFAQASAQRLLALVGSPEDQRAVTALLVAGNIGDRESVDILRAGMNNEREVVQIGAAAGAKAMLRVIDGRLGGTQSERQRSVQRMLGDKLAITRSGHVAQSLIGALTALPEDAPFMAVSSGLIIDAMASQAALRRQGGAQEAMDNGWAGAMERAIATHLSYLRAASIAGADVNRESQLQGARLAGITLSLVRDLIQSTPEAQRAAVLSEHARLIRASETLIVLVESNLTARTDRQQVMGGLITREDDRGLINAINTWVGPRGVLTGAPFSFRAAEFGN